MKDNTVYSDIPAQAQRSPFLETIKRHPLAAFFLIAFGISWAGWFLLLTLQPSNLPAFKWTTNSLELPLPAFLIYRITAYGPFIAAIVMTAIVSGRQGLRAFFGRFLLWRVGWRWYVVAIFSFPLISMAIVVLYTLLAGLPAATPFLASWYAPFLWAIPLLVLATVLAGLPEEPGWRGYALPQLLSHFNPLLASIILGFLWGLWHLPIFILDADNPLNFLLFMLQIIPLSILFTWVYLHTKRSILISILFHGAVDGLGAIFLAGTSGVPANLAEAVMIWVAALIVIAFFGPRLTRKPVMIQEGE